MSSKIMKKTFVIANMTCAHCESRIEQELGNTKGVINAIAYYVKGLVTVTYDENIISARKIAEILESINYHVKTPSRDDKTVAKQEPVKRRDYGNITGTAIIIMVLAFLAWKSGLLNMFYNFPVAKEGMGYGMLFIIGLLTSIHCVGMCGGICLSQSISNKTSDGISNRFSTIKPSILYNVGRVISYTLIGGMVGALGSVISFSGTMKGIVQILAGVFMVIMGINLLGIFPWLRRFNPRMPKIFANKINAQKKGHGAFYIGLLNGLMPCGPLQAMQLYALSTGSPVKGAISMLLFSLGTVPLMFAFGAVSTLLNKKFTGRMMTVSAILVVLLGVSMFGNGISLSGLTIPSLTANASTAKDAPVATIQEGVQTVTSGMSSRGYEPIVVQKGIPVKWTIRAEDGDITGCNNQIIVQKYGIQKDLNTGDNVIEFTPQESGTVPFSCWMGMVRSKIVVVDDLNNIDNSQVIDDTIQSSGGGCCGGGASYQGSSSPLGGNNLLSEDSYSGTGQN